MKKLLLLFAAILMASTGLWAETVDYLYPVYNTADDPTSGIKEWKTASVDATVVTDAATPVTWGTAGETTWYVVTGTDVTLSQGAICSGNVHLILADGAKLTASGYGDDFDCDYAGIQVSGNGNSLTIYGQAKQTGILDVTGGSNAAGIGGRNQTAGSNITINGGTVMAEGSAGAGIGGGESGSGFNITINGGTVTAKGFAGAGIGGGPLGKGSDITINGGMVTATSENGAGIGGGQCGSGYYITINGGTITATSSSNDASGVGGGHMGLSSNIRVATNLIVQAGNIEYPFEAIATDRSYETDIAFDLAGKQYATIRLPISTTYIDENGEAQEVDAIEVRNSFIPVTWGVANTTTWYIVNDANVRLAAGAICKSDVHLILADGAVLTATGEQNHAGIEVSGGNSLTIYGQTAQTGKLEANGGEFAAGIGGGDMANGSNITINGGTVTANGGEFAAGIGGGYSDEGFNITINGGNVTATGINGGAGIGGGTFGSGFNITINGGTVTANGEKDAACIGGGHNADGSNICVATTLLVKADGNNPPTEEIEHDGGGDIAGKLYNKRYATIVSILPFWNSANAAIDAAFKGITNENMKAIATTAKKNIEAATTTVAIGSIKEKALADLQYVLSFYNDGKADAFGTLSEKQNGPALIVTDKDDKEIILYSPKSVEYIKVKE